MPDPYTVAAWRFEQIAPLVDASLDEGARRAALRTRARTPVEWPGADERRRRGRAPKKQPIPKSTLYRWVAAYQSDGYLGLLPKGRSDRGKPRHAGTPATPSRSCTSSPGARSPSSSSTSSSSSTTTR